VYFGSYPPISDIPALHQKRPLLTRKGHLDPKPMTSDFNSLAEIRNING